MKNLFSFKYLLISVCVLNFLYSCSKGDSNPVTPTPAPKPDTLTAGWSKITFTSPFLSDVVFQNSLVGYVEASGSIYKSMDGGNTWSKLSKTFYGIKNIAVTNDGKLFVVGTVDTVYKSTDGGASFSYVATGKGSLTDIFFSDNNTGYIPFSNGMLLTTDGGITWAPVIPTTGLSIPTIFDYNSIFFFNSSTGWISVSATSAVYKTNGNINSWTKSNIVGIGPFPGILVLFATSPSVVYLGSGAGNIFKSTDGGANFSVITTFAPVSHTAYLDLHFIDANVGYASYTTRIYKTVDGGATWTPVVSLGYEEFVEIHFVDATHGWACTNHGSILKLN